MRISDWSSDVCSSDLGALDTRAEQLGAQRLRHLSALFHLLENGVEHRELGALIGLAHAQFAYRRVWSARRRAKAAGKRSAHRKRPFKPASRPTREGAAARSGASRSEEHTSELQSLMRISYAVFCLKKKK